MRRRSGIAAACDADDGFPIELWPIQRRLLAEVERGPRLHVWALGRRSSKSTMAALVCLWDALMRPQLNALVRPGERRYAVAVATNLRQARLIVAAARSLAERSPFASLIESATDDEITFRNGTAIAAFPCTARGGRGWPISCLVLDELAHHLDGDGNSAAESVWQALTPSTAQFGNHARLIACSTPWGSDGLFASLYARAANGELSEAQAHHATTAEANPTIRADFLDAEEARDPESFRSEYLAEFVGGGAAFLDPERIAEAVTDRGELGPQQATGWVAGLDPAFARDPFGLALVARDPANPRRLVLGLSRSWKPRKGRVASFDQRRDVEDAVLDEVAEVCRAYGARIATDQYAAPAITDYLRRRGLSVRAVPMTAASKTAAFAELRALLNVGALDLYEQSELLAELRRLRTKYSAGSAGVVNPRVGGTHGDLAQALALAVFEHRYAPLLQSPSIGHTGRNLSDTVAPGGSGLSAGMRL